MLALSNLSFLLLFFLPIDTLFLAIKLLGAGKHRLWSVQKYFLFLLEIMHFINECVIAICLVSPSHSLKHNYMSCNSCARATDIEMNVLLPFSKFIRSLSKSNFGVDLRKKEKKNQAPKFTTHRNLPYYLYSLFAPASVIIYSERISMKHWRLYRWLCNAYYQTEMQRCAQFRTLISNIHHVENYLL